MSKQEIYWTSIGEMLDMISCLAIVEGGAKPKQEKKTIKIEDLLNRE